MLKNSVRIIGGQWRGRQIPFNPSANIRPTPDRVRETLFNWLMGQVSGARCLDLFAGSGILGLEALSRGAAFLCSLEKDPKTCTDLKAALHMLKAVPKQWQVERGDAIAWLEKSPDAHRPAMLLFDIIFIDPPYNADLWTASLRLIRQKAWLAEDGVIYLESNRPLIDEITTEGFKVYREKKASSVYAYLVIPAA